MSESTTELIIEGEISTPEPTFAQKLTESLVSRPGPVQNLGNNQNKNPITVDFFYLLPKKYSRTKQNKKNYLPKQSYHSENHNSEKRWQETQSGSSACPPIDIQRSTSV